MELRKGGGELSVSVHLKSDGSVNSTQTHTRNTDDIRPASNSVSALGWQMVCSNAEHVTGKEVFKY